MVNLNKLVKAACQTVSGIHVIAITSTNPHTPEILIAYRKCQGKVCLKIRELEETTILAQLIVCFEEFKQDADPSSDTYKPKS